MSKQFNTIEDVIKSNSGDYLFISIEDLLFSIKNEINNEETIEKVFSKFCNLDIIPNKDNYTVFIIDLITYINKQCAKASYLNYDPNSQKFQIRYATFLNYLYTKLIGSINEIYPGNKEIPLNELERNFFRSIKQYEEVFNRFLKHKASYKDNQIVEKIYFNMIEDSNPTDRNNRDYSVTINSIYKYFKYLSSMQKMHFNNIRKLVKVNELEEYIDADKLFLFSCVNCISSAESLIQEKYDTIPDSIVNYIKYMYDTLTQRKEIISALDDEIFTKINRSSIKEKRLKANYIFSKDKLLEETNNIIIKLENRFPELLKTEQKEEIEEPKAEPKRKKLENLSDLFTTQLIIDNDKQIKIPLKKMHIFKNDINLESILTKKYTDIINKFNINRRIILRDLELVVSINKLNELEIKLDLTSVLQSFVNELKIKFPISSEKEEFITQLGYYIQRISNLDSMEEYELDKLKEYYFEYLTSDEILFKDFPKILINNAKLLIELYDEIKSITNTPISIETLEQNINIEKYYLKTAIDMFNEYRSKIISKEPFKKEKYIFLALYIDDLKNYYDENYDLKLSYGGKSYRSKKLIEEYDELIKLNPLYDLSVSEYYSAISTPEGRKNIVVSWEIIPDGQKEQLKQKLEEKNNQEVSSSKQNGSYNSSFQEKYLKVCERQNFLLKTEYDSSYVGKAKFEGYVGFGYPNGIIILEKFFEDGEKGQRPCVGNATYIMSKNNFIEKSSMSKTELIKYIQDGNSDVKRIFHTQTWKNKLLDLINNTGYTEEMIAELDELTNDYGKGKILK